MMYEQQQQHPAASVGRQMNVRRRFPAVDKQQEKTAGIEEERLAIVDLSGKALSSLPNPSLTIGAICKLDISNNNLESIPESVAARLLNVVVLDVHSNQLQSLPNSIGCLSKLKVLNMSGNLLQTLPKTIENCRSLEDLNANFNKLTKLPDTMGFELLKLRKLSVNSNKLMFLPYSVCHLTNLRTLDVRLNCLRALPEDLENLVNLQVLNASQNFQYLAVLPDSLGLLMSLVELDISYNAITALPGSLGCLRKLQKLCIEGNPLVSPPVEVFEQGGLLGVKEYLSEKMNGAHRDSPKKKSWWLARLVKNRTFNGRGQLPSASHEEDNFSSGSQPSGGYRHTAIEALASPRYTTMFSPRRFLSTKTYFTR
ncbi:plant intracellular Ras-group-related LRR protein 6-like [Diospyros lotus]|uniref:plant intracellular Ras-group-related LRR protein 6-like n=1 Tax=Diospyros lotus TaxID=55363 RepID=UPI00225A028B|nr:plant intracellular Ras-group-related LRR protein 6-like [Diospyros lotus]